MLAIQLVLIPLHDELNIPIYLYEHAAKEDKRKNLANVRSGEYEGLEKKIKSKNWEPDFGKEFNKKSGATAVGVRDFLIAYNINLNTKSTRLANAIAFDVREKGRIKRKGQEKENRVLNSRACWVHGSNETKQIEEGTSKRKNKWGQPV